MSEASITFQASLDMASVPQLTEMVEAASQGHDRLVVDMTAVDFVDSTGVRSLLSLRRQLEESGKLLVFEGFRPEILDIFDILGVRDLVTG